MSGIIDCHVHLYSPEVAADPRGWAAARGELHWAELVAPPDGRPSLQGWVTVDQLLRDMDEAGVERVVLQGWYWESQNTCAEQNRWYAEWAAAHPDRISWFATLQPAAGQAAVEELRRAAGEGALGAGELSPAAQGWFLREEAFLAVAETARDLRLPFLFHVNEVLGRQRPGRRFDRLEDFQWLAATFPDLRLILAHWGGLIPFFELNRAVRKDLRNVFYDTAASPLLYDARIYQAVADAVGADKILFGTDYPLRLYPKSGEPPGFARMVEEVRSSLAEESARAAILGGNARRLLFG